MPNIDGLKLLENPSTFRRISIGTWTQAYDCHVYGSMDVRMDKALQYIEAFRARTGRRLTVTHLVAKAAAEGLRRVPEANALMRFNRIYLRPTIDVSILVVQPDEDGPGKIGLTACTIREVDKKGLLELAQEIDEQVNRARNKQDDSAEQAKKTTRVVPLPLMNAFLKLYSGLLYSFNLDLRRFGIPRDPFGGIAVTNVGSLGLETAFVPLVPYTRIPSWVTPGVIRDAAVVENGKCVPAKVMTLCASFDHRFVDGAHASTMAKAVRELLENPFEKFDAIDKLPPAVTPVRSAPAA